LGFAWYQKLKPIAKDDCKCCDLENTSFMESKKFLGFVTALSILLLTIPSYGHKLFQKEASQSAVSNRTNIQKIEFKIEGMTCTSCESHVNREVNKLDGIVKSTASYANGNAIIEFDTTMTNIEEIENSIAETGYAVSGKRKLQ